MQPFHIKTIIRAKRCSKVAGVQEMILPAIVEEIKKNHAINEFEIRKIISEYLTAQVKRNIEQKPPESFNL